MPSVTLTGRAFLTVSGKDAEDFLQALITTDLPGMAASEIRPGALLTPQGKILFDFLIVREGDGFLLETSADQRDGLIKRLSMYKLRAAVEIAASDVSEAAVSWGEAAPAEGAEDSRFAKAGIQVRRRPGAGGSDPAGEYDALRIACGIPESGRDFDLSDAFPHDVLLDLTGGLSFRKGCYVGQEVISRMHHRGTARKRPVIVAGAGVLPPTGTELLAGGKPLGALGTVVGDKALAIVRIDRVADALAAGSEITADGVPAIVMLPEWSGLSFPQDASEVPGS
ncbi:folate-binding protein YgfZ [Sinorhizobium sp. BG8]|uniref:CAF17-like 4Fe-4S cluster assembly/insertion protein YgfZ n=1 Tax=Sinorhizobium sp. BG8 TaxID=2613773 RepID=UPI00193E212A|nr:folate-binding protein YgfZ [Sinorhizobium sp. BG8]QRM54840.1 folate-binding protein YgfZ [Sinorhizobium sp. BG8]